MMQKHVLGTVNIGVKDQSTRNLRATTAGQHHITVNANADGATKPFATAEYQVETLELVVPPNITLNGETGTSSDGTSVARCVSPLTVNASFNNPKAVRVTLTAVDGDDSTYEHNMNSANSVYWTHTFTPSRVGLWESPV